MGLYEPDRQAVRLARHQASTVAVQPELLARIVSEMKMSLGRTSRQRPLAGVEQVILVACHESKPVYGRQPTFWPA